jgi:hypothetical protein
MPFSRRGTCQAEAPSALALTVLGKYSSQRAASAIHSRGPRGLGMKTKTQARDAVILTMPGQEWSRAALGFPV